MWKADDDGVKNW